jgi:O-antigen/teichoic acid export membrane protein
MVIIASFAANIFAYLFQLVSGRYFSKEEYGVLIALFSLSGLIPLVAQFFVSGIPKLVAEIKDVDYPTRISSLFYAILKVNTVLTVITFVLMLVLKDEIASFLNITDTSVIMPFIFAVSAGTLMLFITPFIQGLARFKAYSFITLLTAIAKLAVAVIVMFFALEIKDIFWGLTIATLALGVMCYKILLKNINLNWRLNDTKDLETLVKYSLGGALSLIGLSLLNLSDVILVKHFFAPDLAGVYGSISVIGRIVFYAASPVAIVMLPICTEKFKKGEDFIKPFFSSLAIALAICLTATFIYFEFPHLIITALFGKSYLAAEPYLGIFAIFMLVYTMLFIFSTFYIAISKFFLSSLVIISAILQLAGIWVFHENIYQVVYVSIFSVSIVLIIYLFTFWDLVKKRKAMVTSSDQL